mgnify:FL=1
MSDVKRVGYVALVGRPNVGKSTLLNALVGERVAIVTHKPQTTRHQIRGWVTQPEGQAVFVDTPGMHSDARNALNHRLNRVASQSLVDVDAVVMVVDAMHINQEDIRVLEKLATTTGQAKILVFNKIDQLKDRSQLLKQTHDLTEHCSFDAVVYLSAKTGAGLDDLMGEVFARLPEDELIYPADEFTDRPVRFLVAELVREQLMLQLHQEIPYGLTVVTEYFEEKPSRVHIHALIIVSEERHKGMVIGKKGEVLKRVGTRARHHIENLLGQPVHLELHVKAQAGWMEDERKLDQLGYAQ